MSRRPLLTSVDLWARHCERCLHLLREALASLDPGPPSESEREINRRLYRAIIAAHQAAAKRGEEPLSVVTYEAQNAPAPSDVEFHDREHKVPDFQWAYIDDLAQNPSAAARHLAIECKRLTEATRNWDFLEQYIANGVERFISVEWSYGKDTPNGVMIGYLQTIDLGAAEAGVNAAAVDASIPVLVLRQEDAGLFELDHTLERPFADSPFKLHHLWISTRADASSMLKASDTGSSG
jgi:hypothetical protein